MYDYHSARNMVQLIGEVKFDPKEYELEAGDIVRFVIEVRDRDDVFSAFYSSHIVVVPRDVNRRCTQGGVRKGDTVLVKGRLFNRKDKETGKVISNVQAHEILCLVKCKRLDEEISEEERKAGRERIAATARMFENPEYQEGRKSGKIVSLLAERCKDKYAPDDEILDYEDEDPEQIPF